MKLKGRKPKPTKLHVLNGNPSKKNLNTNEPKPKPAPGPPKPPSWLTTEAKKEWKRIAPELHRLGLLTIADEAALANYCQAYGHWVQAEKAIKEYYKRHKKLTYEYTNKNGSTNEVPIPEIAIAQKYQQIIKSFCAEFGLTPSSRARIELPDGLGEDDMAGLLSG
ncbi:MAG: phage terminase small subunit P27 family [Archaeoglobus sp.]|nr:phage terminase small subunit P27 family [Archaeoglobus sp.]